MKKVIIFFIFIIMSNVVFCVNKYYVLFPQDGVKISRQYLKNEMGKVERGGNNRGEHIKNYALSLYGKRFDGFAYCYALQYWCIDQASQFLNIKNPLPRTGLCMDALAKVKKMAISFEPYKPAIDDILLFRFGKTSQGHAARVDSVLDYKKQIVRTGEGNTSGSIGNQREGGMNTYKIRNLAMPFNKLMLAGAIAFKNKK